MAHVITQKKETELDRRMCEHQNSKIKNSPSTIDNEGVGRGELTEVKAIKTSRLNLLLRKFAWKISFGRSLASSYCDGTNRLPDSNTHCVLHRFEPLKFMLKAYAGSFNWIL